MQVGIHYRSSREIPQESLEQERAGPVVNVDPVSATVHVSHGVRSKTPFRKVDTSSPTKSSSRSKSIAYPDSAALESIDRLEEMADALDHMPSANPQMRPRSKSLSIGGAATGTARRRSTTRANARRMSAALTVAEHLSSQPDYNSTESIPRAQSQSATELEIAAQMASSLSETPVAVTPENGSVVSDATDLDMYDEEFDIEEDEEHLHNDDGDSDVEFDPDVFAVLLAKNVEGMDDDDASRVSGGSDGSQLYQQEIRHSATAVGNIAESSLAALTSVGSSSDLGGLEKVESDQSQLGVGMGIKGEEGRAVRELFKDNKDLAMLSREAEKEMMISTRRLTFGPGAAMVHPWTSRVDMGINSRLENERRGDEIYYVGIIDILQQYNASKRAETFFKVRMIIF